jgi:hypothetical protein
VPDSLSSSIFNKQAILRLVKTFTTANPLNPSSNLAWGNDSAIENKMQQRIITINLLDLLR